MLSSFFSFSQNQEDSIIINSKLKEITISATKSSISLDNLPIPTSVITEKEISVTSASKLDEVITKETGIISVPTRTGTEGLQIQGLDASYITILIDGSPLIGRSFGSLDLNRISVENIERIEIIKGASSSLYGSNALGGVINLITKKQIEDGYKINLAFKYSSHNTVNPNILYQYKRGKLNLSNSFDFYKTDGYDLINSDLLKTVNPFNNYTFSTKLQYGFSEKFILNSNARYFNQNQLYTNEKLSTLYEGESLINEWNFRTSLQYFLNSKFSQELEIYVTNYNTDEFLLDSNDMVFDDNFYDHTLIQSEFKMNISLNSAKGIIGVGGIKEQLDRKDFSDKAIQDLKFIYAQLEVTTFDNINIIAGTRFDHYSDYSPEISNKLALGISLSDNIIINSSIGSGYKVPDFRQRYFDFTNSTIGYTVLGRDVAFDRLISMEYDGIIQEIFIPFSEINSNLKSETSVNLNIGARYNLSKKLNFNVNFFNNKVNNLIEWQLVALSENNTNIYSYFNINEVETKGIEFNTQYKIDCWEIKLGYQLLYALDAKVLNNFDQDTSYFARDPQTQISVKLNKDDYFGLFNRSRHTGNVKINYQINDKLDINTIITYRSKYGLNDSNGNDILDSYDRFVDGYCLWDIGITQNINSFQSFQVGVKNVLGFTNPEYISNISGRLYFINLKINLT
tara:strand:+ start:449 stop:2494 length:2046 start_codon:yes stop_codon:yes gene_type:complete